MTEHVEKLKNHLSIQFKYIVCFFILFTLISYSLQTAGKLYYRHFDKTAYYQLNSPIPVERKENVICTYVDAYVHRRVLTPVTGTVFRQLVLINIDTGKKTHISEKYTNSFEAGVGDETIIHHWKLPCDIPLGTYQFEGIIDYKVGDIPKQLEYKTELFDIIASPSANLK